jgi:hypothetical protein
MIGAEGLLGEDSVTPSSRQRVDVKRKSDLGVNGRRRDPNEKTHSDQLIKEGWANRQRERGTSFSSERNRIPFGSCVGLAILIGGDEMLLKSSAHHGENE